MNTVPYRTYSKIVHLAFIAFVPQARPDERARSCAVEHRHANFTRLISTLDSNRLEKEKAMLWTLFVILIVLWALGLVTSYTLGGFIHILLLLAVIVLVINLVTGRRLA